MSSRTPPSCLKSLVPIHGFVSGNSYLDLDGVPASAGVQGVVTGIHSVSRLGVGALAVIEKVQLHCVKVLAWLRDGRSVGLTEGM